MKKLIILLFIILIIPSVALSNTSPSNDNITKEKKDNKTQQCINIVDCEERIKEIIEKYKDKTDSTEKKYNQFFNGIVNKTNFTINLLIIALMIFSLLAAVLPFILANRMKDNLLVHIRNQMSEEKEKIRKELIDEQKEKQTELENKLSVKTHEIIEEKYSEIISEKIKQEIWNNTRIFFERYEGSSGDQMEQSQIVFIEFMNDIYNLLCDKDGKIKDVVDKDKWDGIVAVAKKRQKGITNVYKMDRRLVIQGLMSLTVYPYHGVRLIIEEVRKDFPNDSEIEQWIYKIENKLRHM